MNLVEAFHLHKSFGGRVAVHDLSLTIAAGEIYGMVGPDGAGKTTTLRMLCGAYQPSRLKSEPETQIRIAGWDVLHQTEQARGQIGYLPQRFSLYEDLTVIENLRFFAEVRGLPSSEWKPRCMEILTFVGLADFVGRRAGHLSGGMRQKLGLAAALVHRPKVLLLDEPTTGVDPVTRQDFWQLIIHLVADNHGTAVLVSTPYMDEASRCTRVGFMRQGRMIVEGPPGQLCAELKGRVFELAGSPLTEIRKSVEKAAGVLGVQMFGDRLHLRLPAGQAEATIRTLSGDLHEQGFRVERFRLVPPQLEDVFMELLEVSR